MIDGCSSRRESRVQMDNSLKVPYGWLDGRLVHVQDVPSGLGCNCVCPACGSRLVAVKGQQRVEHFRHHAQQDCSGGPETTLHWLAKQLIAQSPALWVPELIVTRQRFAGSGQRLQVSLPVREAETLAIHHAAVEVAADGYRPDVVLVTEQDWFLVEITVTHPVDSEKLAKLQAANMSVLEIQLPLMCVSWPAARLAQYLAQDVRSKQWLHHRLLARTEQDVSAKLAALVDEETARYVQEQHAREAARHRFATREALPRPTPDTPKPMSYADIKGRRSRPVPVGAAPSTPSAAPPASGQKGWGYTTGRMKEFLEHERQVERFRARHGRYPTFAEMERWKSR